MSIVANSKVLERGLRAEFVKAFNNAEDPSDIAPFLMVTTSTGADEEYGWLGQSPSMTEWVDERKIKALNEFGYKLKNKDFEATLGVKRNDLEDDRLGNIKIRINDLAIKAKQTHPRKLFFDALNAGTVDLCYDGQPLFSASHSEGDSGTQTNLKTGSGVTLANLKSDIEACVAQMKKLKDDTGEPYFEGDFPIGIICPLELESLFKDLNTLEKINDNTNSMRGKLTILSSGRLGSDVNDWYFVNISPGLKPFIRQIRQAVKFSSQTDDSQDGFMRKVYYYGVDSREVFGYGVWQKIIKVTN